MRASEHIVLESSDELRVPHLKSARRTHARVLIRSGLRRHTLELSLFDYYFLGVRTKRALSNALEYVVDLRLVDPSLRLTRHVAWRWLAVTLGLAILFGVSVWYIGSSSEPWSQHRLIPVSAVLLVLAGVAGFICAYRTTETLALYSVHGRARLLQFTGGLGTFRRMRQFTGKLAAHLRIATQCKGSKAEQLRRELREHFRLKETGLLSEEDYEASKLRILRQHG